MSVDHNYTSIADVGGLHLPRLIVTPTLEEIAQFEFREEAPIADVLKFSNASNVQIDEVVVDAKGRQTENAIDMNRGCRDIRLGTVRIVCGGQNGLTIKGGCKRISINRLIIEPGRGHCEMEFGNWSDQSLDWTDDIVIGRVERTDVNPSRYRVIRARRVDIRSGYFEYQRFQSAVAYCYWWAKRVTR